MRALLLVSLVISGAVWAEDPTPASVPSAEAIMSRVAENQDRAEALRAEYVYNQHIHVASIKTNGKLMREEDATYAVTPGPGNVTREQKSISGRYWHKGKYLTFRGDPIPDTGVIDSSLVEAFREDLMNDTSKDGIARDLFPLTSSEQKNYVFQFLKEEERGGRKAYRIAFRPKDKDEITWAGEAVIDAEDFQPVQVFTKMSRRIPFAVRTLLGTDLPGLGFNVDYRRQSDGVWFPASFGTEFRLHAVFFINRKIVISMENTDFERTHVESRIKEVEPE